MRYALRAPSPRADDGWWDNGALLPALVVDGAKEIDTGLVDPFGNEIVRVQPPIGFGRDGEW